MVSFALIGLFLQGGGLPVTPLLVWLIGGLAGASVLALAIIWAPIVRLKAVIWRQQAQRIHSQRPIAGLLPAAGSLRRVQQRTSRVAAWPVRWRVAI